MAAVWLIRAGCVGKPRLLEKPYKTLSVHCSWTLANLNTLTVKAVGHGTTL